MESAEIVRIVLSILGTLIAVFAVITPIALYIHKSIMEVIKGNSTEAWAAITKLNESLNKLSTKIAVIMTRMNIHSEEEEE